MELLGFELFSPGRHVNRMNSKKIQVTQQFFDSVVELLDGLDRSQLSAHEWQLVNILENEIEQKAAAKLRREKFTEYKTTKPGEERDAKRIDYLVEAGKTRSWKSDKEIRKEEPPN